jgi:Glycosyltransferase family 87
MKRDTRLLTDWAWLAAGVFGALLFFWRTLLPATRTHTYAFSAYYTAARLTLQGQAGIRFCGEWFFEQQRALGFGNRADFFCPNPPTTALIMLPVAWLPPRSALAAWVACTLALVAGIIAVGWRIVTREPELLAASDGREQTASSVQAGGWRFIALAAIVVPFFRPLHADFLASQVYSLIALLYAFWLYGYLSRRDWLCGAALAGLALAKLSGWPLWLLMIAARRWRTLGWALGVGLAGLLLSLPLLGLDFWRLYLFDQLLAIPAEPSSAVPANQTLSSLLRQCFAYDQHWAPRPLLDAPWLALALWWALALALLAATLSAAVRRPAPAIPMAMICLVIPLQPAGEEYHYTLLLLVLLLLLATWRGLPALAALLGAALLFALPAYFVNTAVFGGWPQALLAYPRMYAALLLWGLLMLPGVGDQLAGHNCS